MDSIEDRHIMLAQHLETCEVLIMYSVDLHYCKILTVYHKTNKWTCFTQF